MDTEQLSDKLRMAFVKHYDLPIQLVKGDYFEYFIDLYNEELGTYDKYAEFLNVITKYFEKPGIDLGYFVTTDNINKNFLDFITSFQYDVINKIKEVPEYKTEFLDVSLDKFPCSMKQKKGNLYCPENDGKVFMSVDLKKANFQAMKYVSPHLVLGTSCYREMLSQVFSSQKPLFGEVKLLNFLNGSKQMRQYIFGNLNCSRQIHIIKHLNEKVHDLVYDAILNEFDGSFKEDDFISFSHDETVLRFNSLEEANRLKKRIKHYDFKDVSDFRVDIFELEMQYPNDPFYVKVYVHSDGVDYPEKTEIKTVPDYFYAQAHKYYYHKPLNKWDMGFFHEGLISEFLEKKYAD